VTFGLACDRDGYDLRFARQRLAPPCSRCSGLMTVIEHYCDRCAFPNLKVPRLTDVPNRLYGATLLPNGDCA
jgi:hypothetical protein